jgi:ABC-type Fe3+ transport system permease subunit
LMLLMFQSQRRSAAIGSAEILSQSRQPHQAASGFRLLWQLEDRALFWTFSTVFFWSFFNLTAASLLMPLSIVPLPAQLYNLMHYGRTMSLSAQALLSVLVPVTVIALTAWFLPRVERLLSHCDQPKGVS